MGAFSLFDGGLYPVGVPAADQAPTVGYSLFGLVGFSVGSVASALSEPTPEPTGGGGAGGIWPLPRQKPKTDEDDEDFLLLF